MVITDKQLQSFIALYEKEYGIKITVDKAKDLAMKLLLLLQAVID